ncbi:hypothetical protein BX666DRAFT_1883182 [Dichotomocladium elegans]|nr:hypothetical protein BX666DRAFT_1883182 [Dichotomocladium elegans]
MPTEAIHSRSASDSSKRELIYEGRTVATATADDPYARNSSSSSSSPHRLNSNACDSRANSYLPYSHHARDPLVPVPPIYIDDQGTLSSAAAPQGEQDRTISLQQIESSAIASPLEAALPHSTASSSPSMPAIPGATDPSPLEKLSHSRWRRRRRRPIQWRLWILLGIVFCAVVAVVWYFCWPRIPSFKLTEIDNIDDFNVFNTTLGYYSANWTLNLTADNTANWIPTRFHALSVIVYDRNTHAQIGDGRAENLKLRPRQVQLVSIPLRMEYAAGMNDTTFQDLLNGCYIDERGQNSMSDYDPDGLNLDFLLHIRIAGIAWTTTQNVSTPKGFSCPL